MLVLNDDCIIYISIYLEWYEIINLMKTCKRFYNLFYDEDRYEKIKKYIQHNYTKYCEYFIIYYVNYIIYKI